MKIIDRGGSKDCESRWFDFLKLGYRSFFSFMENGGCGYTIELFWFLKWFIPKREQEIK